MAIGHRARPYVIVVVWNVSHYTIDRDALVTALQIVQIAFYVTAGIIAVLTYRSAKKGLLNTVRTEYQKRVTDRLAYLAGEIWAEFDRSSPNWWANFSLGSPLIDPERELYKRAPDYFKGLSDFDGGYPLTPVQLRLADLQTEIETDPFLPREIRDEAVQYLAHRRAALEEANLEAICEYRKYLSEKQPPIEDVVEDHHWVHNRVLSSLTARQADIVHSQKSVAKLRLNIQRYLESFDPGK